MESSSMPIQIQSSELWEKRGQKKVTVSTKGGTTQQKEIKSKKDHLNQHHLPANLDHKHPLLLTLLYRHLLLILPPLFSTDAAGELLLSLQQSAECVIKAWQQWVSLL